jgi:threonine dehydrogenase-like Zn-dependent dehydrogenase
VGAGSIGLLTVAALRALVPEVPITVLARHPFQSDHARRLGAAQVVMGGGDVRAALASASGARLLKTIIGPQAVVGGFDRTFVCTAGARAVDEALNLTRAGGTVVLLGNARGLDGIDWTPLWLKELTLRGSLTYGGARTDDAAAHGGAARGDFEEAMALIAGRRADIGSLVTHTFPLAEHAKALATAMDKRARSVKVAFRY